MSPFRASVPLTGTWEHFQFSVADGIATVTLDRPGKLNALTFEAYADLRDLLAELPHRGDTRVLVIRGKGRAFCSGGDVNEIIGATLAMSPDELLAFTRMSGEVIREMRDCPVPVIAAVHGMAAGAGAVIALAADFRVCTPAARFAFLFTKVGLSGGDMGAAYLHALREFAQDVRVPAVLRELTQGVQVDPAQRERPQPVPAEHVVQVQARGGPAGGLACLLVGSPVTSYEVFPLGIVTTGVSPAPFAGFNAILPGRMTAWKRTIRMTCSGSWPPRTHAAPTSAPWPSCGPDARPATGCGSSSRRSQAWDTARRHGPTRSPRWRRRGRTWHIPSWADG